MFISIDFGGSTIDVIEWKDGQIKRMSSFDSGLTQNFKLENVLSSLNVNLKKVEKILVTGGKSRMFPGQIFNIPVVKINEIEAIGRGGWELINSKLKTQNSKPQLKTQSLKSKNWNRPKDHLLVVSMGTGTCMVEVRNEELGIRNKESRIRNRELRIGHIGGTGVGGGTFLGLAKEILGETDIRKLIKMFKKGDRRKVDLSVGEIVGKGIGRVPAWGTASNLGKLWRADHKEIKFSKNDLAAGIANLIGQTIGITAVFAAQAHHIPLIVLTGKLTQIERITEIIFEVGKVYGIKMVLPENADFVGAVGAGKGEES